jgi:hypothetical protein
MARCLSPQNIDTMHRFSDVQCVRVRVYACIFARRLVSATTSMVFCCDGQDTRVSENNSEVGVKCRGAGWGEGWRTWCAPGNPSRGHFRRIGFGPPAVLSQLNMVTA